MAALRVGMLGCGVVGTGVARLLADHARPLADRAGVPIELARVAADPGEVDGRVALAGGVTDRDPGQLDRHARPVGDGAGVVDQQPGHAGADHPAAEHADP